MKNILITGLNSYVGTQVGTHLKSEGHAITYISLKNEDWNTQSFKSFDVLFHVAGIAHVSHKKVNQSLYQEINCDLTEKVAKKAQSEGITQFIFMSSIMVYDESLKEIKESTGPAPSNIYGQSKLNAENILLDLQSDAFSVSIIRAPMIYGAQSTGNFFKLRSFALKTKLFPAYQNQRSMLYINNLALFVSHLIGNHLNGVFTPQNPNYSSTHDIVLLLNRLHGRKIYFTKIFNPFIRLIKRYNRFLNKIFGDFYYESKKDILPSFNHLEESLKEIEMPHEK